MNIPELPDDEHGTGVSARSRCHRNHRRHECQAGAPNFSPPQYGQYEGRRDVRWPRQPCFPQYGQYQASCTALAFCRQCGQGELLLVG